MQLRYGLGSSDELGTARIASHLKTTTNQIRAIEDHALAKLRGHPDVQALAA